MELGKYNIDVFPVCKISPLLGTVPNTGRHEVHWLGGKCLTFCQLFPISAIKRRSASTMRSFDYHRKNNFYCGMQFMVSNEH